MLMVILALALGFVLGVVISTTPARKVVNEALGLADEAIAQRDAALNTAREAQRLAHDALEQSEMIHQVHSDESEEQFILRAGLHMHVHGEGKTQ